VLDDDLLLIVNGWWEQLSFTLPDVGSPRTWIRELDTYAGLVAAEAAAGAQVGPTLTLGPRSLVLLRSSRAED
jgi:hypothetical protein